MDLLKRTGIPCIVLLLTCFALNAQDTLKKETRKPVPSPEKKFSWEKVSIGGNLGFSRYFINISPTAGYMVTEKLMLGAGGTYISISNPIYREIITIYGGKVFGRYFVKPYLFGHAEIEELNGPWDPISPVSSFWINTTLVGAGYRQFMGGSFYMDGLILFNINEHSYSPYRNPIFRIGFNVGL